MTDVEGQNRKERKLLTHAKLAAVTDEIPLIVKTADRLANLRQVIADGNQKLLKMYRGEHEAFREAVHRPGLAEEIWTEIDTIIAEKTEVTHG